MKPWTDISGWLSDEEGEALQRLATDAKVLEIGSYMGRSTCCMAATAKSITAVDHHQGDQHIGLTDTLSGFLANVEECCKPDKVHLILKRAEDIDWSYMPSDFDVVFIDAAHDTESVERHTRIALQAVRSGGVIVWHDWGWETVRKGIWACGLEPNVTLTNMAWMIMP
jgi:predicted O-methyltransferase YrrM